MRTSIERLKQMGGKETDDVVAYMEQLASRPEQSRRFFAVGFRDSNVRVVFPNDSDPLKFEQQITADKVCTNYSARLTWDWPRLMLVGLKPIKS